MDWEDSLGEIIVEAQEDGATEEEIRRAFNERLRDVFG